MCYGILMRRRIEREREKFCFGVEGCGGLLPRQNVRRRKNKKEEKKIREEKRRYLVCVTT